MRHVQGSVTGGTLTLSPRRRRDAEGSGHGFLSDFFGSERVPLGGRNREEGWLLGRASQGEAQKETGCIAFLFPGKKGLVVINKTQKVVQDEPGGGGEGEVSQQEEEVLIAKLPTDGGGGYKTKTYGFFSTPEAAVAWGRRVGRGEGKLLSSLLVRGKK